MGRNDRIRVYGARLNRFAHRFFIFFGMLALFSLFVGASAEGEERRVAGALLVLALSVGIVIGWFASKRQRELDRSQQLAAETTLLFPYIDAAGLDHEYTLRKRREKRLEALFYLILAVLTGLWFWAMYAAEANEASWMIGFTVIMPGLLLISAVLFIISILPVRQDEKMPGVSRLDLELARTMLKTSEVQPDDKGVQTVHALSLEEECKTAEEYLRRERSQQRGNTILLKFGKWFFVVIPLILFVFGLIIADAGGPKWFVLFTGILVLMSTALWIFMTHAPGGMGSAASASRRLRQMKSDQYRVIQDTILSHRMGDGAAEIEFAQSGKVRVPCRSNNEYIKFFSVPRHAAILALYKGRIQSIALLRDDDAAAQSAADQPNGGAAPDVAIEDEALRATVLRKIEGMGPEMYGEVLTQEEAVPDVDLETIMSDEALHEAALREIECMSPSRRREMEVEIEQMFRAANPGTPYLEMTTLERGAWHDAVSSDLRKSTVDITLNAIESYVMERLNVPRSAIMKMTKNPFAPAVRSKLLIAVLVGIGGALVTAIIEKTTSRGLGYVYLIVSVLTGGIAMSCAEDFSTMLKFRKLQKAYQDPKYRRKVLDAAVYRELRERVKQSRQMVGLM